MFSFFLFEDFLFVCFLRKLFFSCEVDSCSVLLVPWAQERTKSPKKQQEQQEQQQVQQREKEKKRRRQERKRERRAIYSKRGSGEPLC